MALPANAGLAGGARGAARAAVARIAGKIGAIAVDAFGSAGSLTAINPAWRAAAAPTLTDQTAHCRTDAAAGAAMVAVRVEIGTVLAATGQPGRARGICGLRTPGAWRWGSAATILPLGPTSRARGARLLGSVLPVLVKRRPVPISQVSTVRPGHHGVDCSPAGGHLLFADANRDQRPSRRRLDAHLKGMPICLSDDGHGAAVRLERLGVFELARRGDRELQSTAHLARFDSAWEQRLRGAGSQAHRGGERERADAGVCAATLACPDMRIERTEKAAGSHGADCRTA